MIKESLHVKTFFRFLKMNCLIIKINSVKGFKNYFSVGKVYSNKSMFKYMNLETALLCLEKG